jgi:hypothetical protein
VTVLNAIAWQNFTSVNHHAPKAVGIDRGVKSSQILFHQTYNYTHKYLISRLSLYCNSSIRREIFIGDCIQMPKGWSVDCHHR